MHQYYQLLNKSNKIPILEKITDLYDDTGESAGTQVLIKIPDNLNFPFVTEETK